MRTVFLGMPCAGSANVLRALLGAGVEVAAVALAGRGDGGEGGATGPAGVARGAGGPVTWLGGAEALAEAVAARRPQAVAAACFPWRVPAAVRALPPLGCLNVHPSLLPAGRGPEPVFWTLRRGERQTGATVHQMDAGFDSGPIVAQAGIAVPPEVRAPDLEARLMALGGELLVESLPRLAAGTLRPRSQPDTPATTAPVPSAADWALPTDLPAGWAWGFARGVAPLGGPLTVLVGATGESIPVRDALDHHPAAGPPEPVVREGEGVVRVRFRPGWVRFAVSP